VNVVPAPMFEAAGLVAWPGWVLPGRDGVLLDVPVPDVLPVVPVVVLDVVDEVPPIDDAGPTVPMIST
jgi:hypothetical protein